MRKSLVGAVLVLLCAVAGCGKSDSEIRRELAPALCDYLDKNFATLDGNNDGLVDAAELTRAKRELEASRRAGDKVSAFDIELLQHALDNLNLIGHVTGSHEEKYTDVTYIIISVDPIMMMPIYTEAVRTVHDYGISRQDIPSYRQRMLDGRR